MQSPNAGRRLPQRKVGHILLSKGKITEEQLQEALELQKAEGDNLGEMLISLDTRGQAHLDSTAFRGL